MDNNKNLRIYLNSISKIKILPNNEIINIFKKKERNKASAKDREKVINSNLRLVVNIVKKYDNRTNYLTILDLISVGNIGLMRAYEKFDFRKGTKFSTYAVLWIKQSVLREIIKQKNLVRRSYKINEICSKIYSLKKKVDREKKNNKDKLSYNEIFKKAGFTDDQIKDFTEANMADIELPFELTAYSDLDSKINFAWIANRIENIIQNESARDKRIIRNKLGFTQSGEDSGPLEVKDVAKRSKLCQESVRQISLRLTDKIRGNLVL